MSETWDYLVTEPALRDLRLLGLSIRQRTFAALDRLAHSGLGDVQKLQGRDDQWRLRVGDYRVLFRRESERRLIVVLHVLPRGRAYRR